MKAAVIHEFAGYRQHRFDAVGSLTERNIGRTRV